MKTKAKEKNMPTKPKLPKARHPRWIIEAAESASLVQHPHGFRKDDWDHYRVAVQDAIAKAAPAIALNESARKFWALTPEERVERLAADMQAAIPNNWVDDLLTGPNAALHGKGGTWGCQDVERLLNAIKQKMPQAARACLAAMGGGQA